MNNCKRCQGTGRVRQGSGQVPCYKCNGTGEVKKTIQKKDRVRCIPDGRIGRVQDLEVYRSHDGIDYFVKFDEPVGDAHYSWYREDELELINEHP